MLEEVLNEYPKEKEYEQYICAYFQNMGYYVEREIIHREEAEILEMDLIITDFQKKTSTKKIIEIKSGKWGFSEIFKVKGWMTFLNIDEGVFIVQKYRNHFDYYKEKASQMKIDLINNSNLSKTAKNLESFKTEKLDIGIINSLRCSYQLETVMMKSLKQLRKRNPDKIHYKNLDDYFFKINSSSFFISNPIDRLKSLFKAYIDYKNITAKIAVEESGGIYIENQGIPKNRLKDLFYEPKYTPLQIALYVEHIARVTIIKTCIDYLLKKPEHSENSMEYAFEKISYLLLPSNFKEGIQDIKADPFFHRYPVFWQFITFVMGGFILKDFEKEEYDFISRYTQIPVDEIPNAIESFNKLFPLDDGWFQIAPHTRIYSMVMFPPGLSGIAANYRKEWILRQKNIKDDSFDRLDPFLTGKKTISDLKKWNKFSLEILNNSFEI